MPSLILRKISKLLILICLFSTSVAFAENTELSSYFDRAKSGTISITELVDYLVEQVIKSPIIGPEAAKYKDQISEFTETASPILITKIKNLILEGRNEQAWAVRSLADNIIPGTWPEGIRISQIFNFFGKIEEIKQKNDVKLLSRLDFSGLAKEDADFLEKVTQLVAQDFLNQACSDDDLFSSIRKIAEISASFPALSAKEKAKEQIQKLVESKDLNFELWTFNHPVVQQFILDIFAENKNNLFVLYKKKILASLHTENLASITYSSILTEIDEEQKVALRKEIVNAGMKLSLNSFIAARANELEQAGQLSGLNKVILFFKGYYGKLPLLALILVLASPFLLLFKKRSSRSSKNVKAVVTDDEYTRLLRRLNLNEDANEAQIKKAFRQLVKEHHPDAHGNTGVVLGSDGKVDQKFEELRKTYDRIMEIRSSWFGANK